MTLEDRIREVIITVKNFHDKDNIVDVATDRIIEIVAEFNDFIYGMEREADKRAIASFAKAEGKGE